jgi:hypothetical protein
MADTVSNTKEGEIKTGMTQRTTPIEAKQRSREQKHPQIDTMTRSDHKSPIMNREEKMKMVHMQRSLSAYQYHVDRSFNIFVN